MVKNVDIYFALVLRGHKNLQSYFIHHVIIEKNFYYSELFTYSIRLNQTTTVVSVIMESIVTE